MYYISEFKKTTLSKRLSERFHILYTNIYYLWKTLNCEDAEDAPNQPVPVHTNGPIWRSCSLRFQKLYTSDMSLKIRIIMTSP